MKFMRYEIESSTIKMSLLISAIVGILGAGITEAALYNTVSITGQLIIPSNCIFSTNAVTINFGTIQQGQNAGSTLFALNVVNSGNIGSNVFVSGASWVYGSNTFAAGNTVWSKSSGTAFGSATALTGSAVDTLVYVPSAGAANTVYWSAAAPLYQAPGSYTQAISITNSC